MGLLLTLAQVLGLIAAVTGIALWSVPLALVVGGLLLVALCELIERRRHPRPTSAPAPDTGPRR